jgi:transposase
LQWLYKSIRKYYGREGLASIDPVVFFKLLLVGYLENLNSDRKIIAHSKMWLDILFFLDMIWVRNCSSTLPFQGLLNNLKLLQKWVILSSRLHSNG